MNPTLILLAGQPGTGKSTLGVALSRALNIPALDKDTLKHTLLAAGLPENIAAPTAYELLFALARDFLLTQRLSVIVDSPAFFPRILDNARALAYEANAPLKIIACHVDYNTRQQRLATRPRLLSHLAADPTPDAEAPSLFAHLPPDTLWLNTAQPLARLVELAMPYLMDGS